MSTNDDNESGIIGVILAIIFVLYIFWENYPTIACLILAVGLLVATEGNKSTWMQAANAMATPAAIGFLLISLLQLFFNWFLDLDASPTAHEPIAAAEYVLLTVATTLPNWLKIGWLPTIAILFAMIPLAAALNHIKPVTHFLWMQKIIGRLVASLTIATTFSFFCGEEILGKYTTNAQSHIMLVYNSSRERELNHLASYISAKATAQMIADMPTPNTTYLTTLLNTTASFKPISSLSMKELAGVAARMHTPESNTKEDRQKISQTLIESVPISQKLFTDTKQLLDQQVNFEKSAEELASRERTLALEEILTKTLTFPVDKTNEIATQFFLTVIEEQGNPLLKEVLAYLGKVADKEFSRMIDPTVKKVASSLQESIYSSKSIPEEAAELAVKNSKIALDYLANKRPRELAKMALYEFRTSNEYFKLLTAAEADVDNFGAAYLNAWDGQETSKASEYVNETKRIINDVKNNGNRQAKSMAEIHRVESERRKRIAARRGMGK